MKTKKWYFPDMYYPAKSNGDEYVSHECFSILNCADITCSISITLYFEEQEPIELLPVTCSPRRTLHFRIDKAKTKNNTPVPQGIGYAGIVTCSNMDAIVQYTRVDTTQPQLALMTTMGYSM
ncbi:sensory rhodopsin transducer [Acetoanaerobium noterae]|uniref:sensory rhodopsin transducer n=1 Tax=Acetoanaerobium noterae TaxID=745369 RepID=UPI0028A92FEA|nr:sensory rhodopsin transducer [Acetoanaerobium noterae]